MLANELGQTEGVTVFCDQPPQIGVVSFRLDAVDVVLTGTILDESSALPCAPACIARRRRTRISERVSEGTVRASFGRFNTHGEVGALVAAVAQIGGMWSR